MTLPWVVLRMRIEAAAGRQVRDMTWANVRQHLRWLSMTEQLQAGKELSREQEIELQKLAKGDLDE